MKDRILVVEDEVSLQESLTYTLEHQGYVVGVVGNGSAAVKMAQQFNPDLVLLDIMLPDLDGFEVCRILRQSMSIPIIFLSARADEIDRIVGLEIGGDDYIAKPFSMRELLARIKARLRMSDLMFAGCVKKLKPIHQILRGSLPFVEQAIVSKDKLPARNLDAHLSLAPALQRKYLCSIIKYGKK